MKFQLENYLIDYMKKHEQSNILIIPMMCNT